MAMTKKDFIALADALKESKREQGIGGEGPTHHAGRMGQWRLCRDAIADVCKRSNPNFDRDRWLNYIDGLCGPNGGRIEE